MTTAFLTHPDCLKHEMGPHHPERPERLQAVLSALKDAGLLALMRNLQAPAATREQLYAAHQQDYVDAIFEAAPTHDYAYLDPDTSMNPYSLSAAIHAAGAVVAGVDLVMKGEADNAFCAVRPCGHHATWNQPMGFCIFNNVAVGAMHAIQAHGLERVAILDFDVHHGNGTEDIFHENPQVMLCSSFQHPFYPGSGADSYNEHIIATPLKAHTDSARFRAAIDATWWPALDEFQPQLIIVSAGFDAHAADPLAQLNLHEDDFAWITSRIREAADTHAEGRIVSALEGGYDLEALGNSAVAHVRALMA